MKSKRKMIMGNKLLITSSFLLLTSYYCLYGQSESPEEKDIYADTGYSKDQIDSIKQVRFGDFAFMIDQIENTYVSGRRGLSDEEWEYGVELAYKMLNSMFLTNGDFLYSWRYLGYLINDAHFSDTGILNRNKAFSKDDIIFPLWVQTWIDGTVYNVKDYTGMIPEYAQILSVNGFYADGIALLNRTISQSESVYAMASMNAYNESEPQLWNNFSNFLHCARVINAPYEVAYREYGSLKADTVYLSGIRRQDKVKEFRRSGDKSVVAQGLGRKQKPIVYERYSDDTGILTINSFWGGNYADILIFRKDARFKRLLKQAMWQIHRDEVENLIIDISINEGGMMENVCRTLNYFTDKPIDVIEIYHITDNNRKLAQTNISLEEQLNKEDRQYLVDYIERLDDGTVFRTDTVRCIQFIPDATNEYRYEGNVYILTGHQTYSAAQLFARYCQVYDIGKVAGQHCGGYNEITGNSVQVILPGMKHMDFKVPFSAIVANINDNPYDYPTVDIPIKQPFEDWLKRENNSLENLLDIILSGNNTNE